MAKKKKNTKVITPVGVLNFPQVFKPKSFNGGKEKFSIMMTFDKGADLSELKRIAIEAAEDKWGTDRDEWPDGLKMPFRDGDKKKNWDGFAGKIFFSASNTEPPGVVDAYNQKIMNPADLYAGCYVRAQVNAFPFDTAGNCGVAFSLQNIQKVKEGKALGGRQRAEDVFEAVETTVDDDMMMEEDDSDLF